jgi:hypothetical protein
MPQCIVSCRTGPLRVVRVLTHLFAGFAWPLPLVRMQIDVDHRETHATTVKGRVNA